MSSSYRRINDHLHQDFHIIKNQDSKSKLGRLVDNKWINDDDLYRNICLCFRLHWPNSAIGSYKLIFTCTLINKKKLNKNYLSTNCESCLVNVSQSPHYWKHCTVTTNDLLIDVRHWSMLYTNVLICATSARTIQLPMLQQVLVDGY